MCLGAPSKKLVARNVVIKALSGVLPCLVDLSKPPTVAIADLRHPPLARIPIGSFSAPWLVTRISVDFARLPSDAVRRQPGPFNAEYPHWMTADACYSFGTNAIAETLPQPDIKPRPLR